MLTNESDPFESLISAAQSGDASATAELVRLYEPEVRMVARVRLGQALRPYLDSVDLVQSVHRSVMVGLRDARFDIASPEKLIALALTIVRRKVARHWRRVQRQQRLSRMTSESTRLPDLFTSLCSTEPDPGAEAARHEQIERLFRQLKDSERNLVQLRLEGYSTAEAARQLGLDPDVARVQLNRLRHRLRQAGTAVELI